MGSEVIPGLDDARHLGMPGEPEDEESGLTVAPSPLSEYAAM